ncbi:MAG: SNF2-related protein [Thermomicrobiales bacterium]
MASTTTAVGTTDYHAKFYAHQVSRRLTGDSPDKLATSLVDALVDLNPHQIDAALFAFQSPLSHGVILADEVGLGKTIEAGLVISQFWAERKRRILVITPANLRKQWAAELADKFHLSCTVVEGGDYARTRRANPTDNPFDRDGREIVIASIPFAAGKGGDLERVPWDLVVIDEAHRLRNASGKLAVRLKRALAGRKKLLLTATPLQNNVIELWGLASLIDEHFFGDLSAFRARYGGTLDQHAFEDLRTRLKPLVQRTLRRDAREFISYTQRIPMLEEFTPTPEEQTLYEMVSEYLQRPNLLALPSGQRHLITMVLRKLLASSTFAIASALRTMATRLERDAAGMAAGEDLEDTLADDFDALPAVLEEWDAEGVPPPLAPTVPEQRAALRQEARELHAFAEQAESIAHNAKLTALVAGLRRAFEHTERIGAPRKAIVFTESRKTQQYLHRVLSAMPEFADGLLLFDGSNADPTSRRIYDDWRHAHAGSDRVTGRRATDIRAALVEYFRDDGQVMIATEAAAEGINLQFCALVINYDLPWNPQRIEQRIGRCHRYGQRHDVVVLNFLNKDNEADQRVYELLDEKFHLFSGVFGASDEVLGTLGSGVDIERRIAEIYQSARTKEEIAEKFQQMQLEMTEIIDEMRTLTERKLLEHFDEDVAERFRVRQAGMNASLDRIERALMTVTKHELRDHATFDGAGGFVLHANPYPDLATVRPGQYQMASRAGKEADQPIAAHLFRPGHPLSLRLVERAGGRALPTAEVVFSYAARPARFSAIESFIGGGGWLAVAKLSIEMGAGAEDHLLLVGFADDGRPLDHDQIEGLFRLPGATWRTAMLDGDTRDRLDTLTAARQGDVMTAVETRIAAWMDQEQAKLDGWAEDRRTNLVGEIEKLDKTIRALRKDLRATPGDLRARRERQLEISQAAKRRDDLEDQNRQRRRDIEREQETLLDRAFASIENTLDLTPLFTIRWRLDR